MISPTVGRIVRYQSYGSPGGKYASVSRAALVTAVPDVSDFPTQDGVLSLAVINPTGLFFDLAVPYSEEPKPGHWSWPPRV